MESSRDDVIRAELRKLLESAIFANSARLASFLTFVVDRTLAADGEQLKETTIGVEVYDRKIGYDPRTEPIVRTEARRLRLKLDEYYQGVGAGDRLRILLPKGRYAPAFEFREEPAVRVIIAPPEIAKPPIWGRRLVFVGIALMVILAIGTWWQTRKQPTQALAPPTIRPLTSYTGTEFQPGFSPDGKHIAFVWDGGNGKFDIYSKPINTGEPVRLTTGAGMDLFPTWTPAGDRIAFLRVSAASCGLYVVSARGGEERKIATINLPELDGLNDPSLVLHKPGPAWSGDGKYLVVSTTPLGGGPNVLYEFAVDGSASRQLTSPPKTSSGDFTPAFSPSGRALAFIRREGARGNTSLCALAGGGTAPRVIDSEDTSISDVAWMSDQRLLFTSNRSGPNTLWQISLKDGLQKDGPPLPLVGAGRGMRFIAYTPSTGSVALEESWRNENIWRARLKHGHTDGPLQKYLFSSRKTDGPDISGDGQAIVFVSDRSGTRQLWAARATGENSKPISAVRAEVPIGTPRWSPDGQKIVYDTVRGGHSVVAVMNADGSNPHVVAADAWDDMMPSWSHDGTTIYFACKINGRLQVCRIPVAGGHTTQITKDGGGEPREGAGGRLIFYAKTRGVWQVSPQGGNESVLPGLEDVENGRYWAVRNDAIFLLKTTQKPWTIYRYDLPTRILTPLLNMENAPNFGSPGLAVAPDLGYLLFGQIDRQGSNLAIVDGLFTEHP